MNTNSGTGILGTVLIVFLILAVWATVLGYNVFDFIKKIVNNILDSFKVLFTFDSPKKTQNNETKEYIDNNVKTLEVKPFDSPDLAVEIPIESKRKIVFTENEIPMTKEDQITSKIQEIKNEKNINHIHEEPSKPRSVVVPVRRSLDQAIQLRSLLTDEDQEYVETFDPSVSKFQTIGMEHFNEQSVTSKVYPDKMNCLKSQKMDILPTSFYQLFQT